MDALSDPAVHTIVFMKSAQVGFTEILINIIGFFIDQEPSPILLVQPTLEMGHAFSKDRLAPALRDSPRLQDAVADAKSKTGDNTLLHKKFPGGHLTITGANSAAGLASRPIRIALFDEVDRYPPSAGSEGDPISLGKKRTRTFANRKIVIGSTPTIKGMSRVETAFEGSDQRFFMVPCPHCGEMSRLLFKDFDFSQAGSVDEPVWICRECGGMATDADKAAMMREGEWEATADFDGIAGFAINEFYSPWSTWEEIVKEFQRAKGDRQQLKTWVNTTLAETWEDEGDAVDPEGLAARAEMYPAPVPAGAVVLTAGVDIQNDRFELDVYGWAEGYERWHIHTEVIYADTSLVSEFFARLDPYLTETRFTHQGGEELGISAACIDSGFRAQQVYAYCAKRYGRRYYAVKGVAGAGKPEVAEMAKPRVAGPKPPKMFAVGTDTLKGRYYDDLQNEEPGANYVHFSSECDQEFFHQMTSEKRVTKFVRGFKTLVWEKVRERNERWDCAQYAFAAVILLRPSWKSLQLRVSKDGALPEPEKATDEPVINTKKDPRRSTSRRRPKNFATSWKR